MEKNASVGQVLEYCNLPHQIPWAGIQRQVRHHFLLSANLSFGQTIVSKQDLISTGLGTKVKRKLAKELQCSRLVKRFLPITDWLFMNYQWKTWLPVDLLAGLTMTVLQVPSGKLERGFARI